MSSDMDLASTEEYSDGESTGPGAYGGMVDIDAYVDDVNDDPGFWHYPGMDLIGYDTDTTYIATNEYYALDDGYETDSF
jgi:hypothetical protein